MNVIIPIKDSKLERFVFMILNLLSQPTQKNIMNNKNCKIVPSI